MDINNKNTWKTYVAIACEADIKQKLDQLLKEKEKATDEYNELLEAYQLKDTNKILMRIMNKWVKVPNMEWYSEDDPEIMGYRYFKVVGAVRYNGENNFTLKVRDAVYIANQTFDRAGRSNDIPVFYYIGNKDDMETSDITKWKVVRKSQVNSAIKKAQAKLNKALDKIIKKDK